MKPKKSRKPNPDDGPNGPSDRPSRRQILAAAASLALPAWLVMQGCNHSTSPTPPPPPPPPPDVRVPPDPAISPAVRAIGDLPAPPERDDVLDLRRLTGNGMTCTVRQRTYSHGALTYPVLDPHFDVIYPGADVQGRSLVQGIPTPITARRGGGSIVISNVNGTERSGMQLSEVSLAASIDAVNRILRVQPDSFPADLVVAVRRVRSREEIQIMVEANASWFGLFSASAGFEVNSTNGYNAFLVMLRQNFYSIAFERPPQPHEFYGERVTLADLRDQMGPGNPPGYVSEITYGRVFYLLVQATESEQSMESTLSANFLLGEAGSVFRYMTQFRNLSIDAYAYGGDQNEVMRAILAGLDDWRAFRADLRTSSKLLLAKPVSYKVRSIATDEVMRNGISAAYEYTDCVPVGDFVPVLLTPSSGATLDNGCRSTSNGVDWRFTWSTDSTADAYQIRVVHPGLGVLVDQTVTGGSHEYHGNTAFLELTGWRWQVRARVAGTWRPWSQERGFSLETPDTDCTTGVRCFQHFDYQGRSIMINEDVPNLENFESRDDEFSSCQLFNIEAVIFYEHPNYQGRSLRIDHSCPNFRTHNGHDFDDKASSLKIVRR